METDIARKDMMSPQLSLSPLSASFPQIMELVSPSGFEPETY